MQSYASLSSSRSRFARPTRAALTLLAALSALNFASAAVLTWDGSDTSNAQADGGTGDWNTSTTNWWDGSANVVWPSSGGNNEAIFANTGNLVFLDSAGLSANKLTFNSSDYFLVGDTTLTLDGTAPTITVASGKSAILGATSTGLVLAGTSGLVKTGTGTITLNGTAPATLTGGITVQRGTLALSLANLATPTDLVPATNTLALQGGTLSVTGHSFTPASQSFTGTSLSGGTSTVFLNKNGGTGTLSLGAITRTPGAILNVTANTALGGTASTSEMVKISAAATGTNGAHAAWLIANNPTTTSGRWVSVDSAGIIRLVSAVGNVADNWSGLTNPAAVYTRSESATLAASATAQAIQSNNLGNSTITIALGANTLTVNGLSCIQPGVNNLWSFTSSTGGITIGAEKELVLIGGGNFAFSAPIIDNPAGSSSLTHAGAGIATISGASTYTGQTTVNAGTFRVGTGGSINSSSGIVVNGGTFSQNNTATALTPTVTLQGGSVGGSGIIENLVVSSGTVTTSSTSTLGLGNLSFTGAGAVNLTASPTTGIAVANALATTLPSGKVTLNVATGPDWGTKATYNLINYGSWSGSLSDFTLGSLPSLGARKSVTLGSTGPSNGTITLTVDGDNVLWTGAASGNWTTTEIASPFNWSTFSDSAPTQFFAGDDVIFNDTATGTTDLVLSDASVSTNTITFANETRPYTVSSPGGFGISAGSLTKSGTGSLTLNTANTYTGGTVVQGGSLVLGHATDTLADTGAVTVATDATVDLGTNSETVGTLNLTGGTITGTTGVLTASSFSLQSGTISANIASTANPIVKSSTGTATLTGTVNASVSNGDVLRVSGGSTVTPSTLVLSPASPSVIGSTVNNNLAVGNAFGDYAVFTQTAGTLNLNAVSVGNTGKGTLNLSGGVINTNSVTLAFTGPFSDNGFVDVNIDGTAAFNVNNNGKITLGVFYGRKVTINQSSGTVSLFSDAGTTLGGTGSLAFEGGGNASAYNLNGGTLAIPAITLRASGSGAGGGSGTLNFGGGTLKITSASFTIPTVAGKTIALNVLGDGSIAGSGANIDTAGNAVTLNAPLVHSGLNEIDGGLTKLGEGTLTLSAPATYTGPTVVSAGSLSVSSADFGDSASVTVASGATLALNFTGADQVAGLTLGATALPAGTYDATSHPDFISGTGSLTVVPVTVPGFAAWASGLGLDGSPSADFDADGLTDAVEYVLGTDPKASDQSGITTERVGDDLIVTFDRDDRSETPDVAVTVESGTDLATWPLVYNVGATTETSTAGVTVTENDSDPDTVSVAIPLGTDPRRFARVRVTVAP